MGCGASADAASVATAPDPTAELPTDSKTEAPGDPNWDQSSEKQTLSRIGFTDDDDTLLQGGFLFKTLPPNTKELSLDLQQSPKLGDYTLKKLSQSMPPGACRQPHPQ